MPQFGPFLILHGWGGNKAEHWQEHLAMNLRNEGQIVHAPKMPDPASPALAAWIVRLHDQLHEIGEASTMTVLAHSLGAITWLHYVTAAKSKLADRVLLISPPYVVPEIPPSDAPPGIASFFPPLLDTAAVANSATETVLIASDNDDYATFEQTKAYADRLNVALHLLPAAGHISPYWGYGPWPWVLDWCLGRATLPPQPRPTD